MRPDGLNGAHGAPYGLADITDKAGRINSLYGQGSNKKPG